MQGWSREHEITGVTDQHTGQSEASAHYCGLIPGTCCLVLILQGQTLPVDQV